MPICPDCRYRFLEPEDEQGDHDCPKCDIFRDYDMSKVRVETEDSNSD